MHTDVTTIHRYSLWREATRIVHEEGFQAFWKGNLVTVSHRLPYSATSFSAYEYYENLMHLIPGFESRGKNISADVLVRFVGGGLAGITSFIDISFGSCENTYCSTDECNLLQRHVRCAVCHLQRRRSQRAISRLGPNFVGGRSCFSVYETLRSWWKSERLDDPDVVMSLGCDSLSGIASSTAIFPLNLVRRLMQLEGAGGRSHVYKTRLGTFRHIVQNEGFRGLYRSILPEYYKVVPGVGIMFMTYETIKNLLSSDTSCV